MVHVHVKYNNVNVVRNNIHWPPVNAHALGSLWQVMMCPALTVVAFRMHDCEDGRLGRHCIVFDRLFIGIRDVLCLIIIIVARRF